MIFRFKRKREEQRPGYEYLALGWLSGELASRARAWDGLAPKWFPEPPEWITLWEEACAKTQEAVSK